MQQVAESHSWPGPSPIAPPFSMPAVPLAGRAVVFHHPGLSQSLMSPGSELSAGARRGVARHQAVPPGSCQLCVGPSHRRLGHLLSSLKDTRAPSLALSGCAERNWGYGQRTCILNGPGALLSQRCWVMLIRLVSPALQRPDGETVWGLWAASWMRSIDACRWMLTACFQHLIKKISTQYSLYYADRVDQLCIERWGLLLSEQP